MFSSDINTFLNEIYFIFLETRYASIPLSKVSNP